MSRIRKLGLSMALSQSLKTGAPGAAPNFWRAISRGEIDLLVRSLCRSYEVVGVQKRSGRPVFDRVDDPAELLLDFPPSVHSPKKYLFPNWEKLFRFRLGGKVLLEAETAAPPRVIFGMHPCDLHAVQVLDNCLFEGEADSAYKAKRDATILVGVDCVPDAFCFCPSMDADRIARGFDLFFHRDGENYLVQAGSERGEALLRQHAPFVMTRPAEPPLPLQLKQGGKELDFPLPTLAPLMEEAYDHPIWERLGDQCLGCGACNLVCPTCYCFNVQDRLDLNLEGGERLRTWDSCQLDRFAQMSEGQDSREAQGDRQRHRFFRKYKYLWDRHQRTACVGCGRCGRECLAGIEPVDQLNSLYAERAQSLVASAPAAEYQPRLAEIIAVEEMTASEKLFRLRLPEPMACRPGAFVQVSVFGLGEAPFTLASVCGQGPQVEIVVRAKGALTQALHRLKPGDSLGLRGPFGSGFDLESMRGRDLLLVAGGLGLIVLRSLLLALLARREEFGRIRLLYGAHDLDAFLFRDELLAWHRGGLIDCRFAVQESKGEFGLMQGQVSTLLQDLDIVPERTVAAVSGPPEMYRFVNPLLLSMGVAEDRLFLNLERHIKCGLGKCGKCRINDLCVCECGPILPYTRIRDLREAIER